MDKYILESFYKNNKLSLKDIFNKVNEKEISKRDFHYITGYNYDGIAKSKNWETK